MSHGRAHTAVASPLVHRPRRLRVTWVRSVASAGRSPADAGRRALDLAGALLLLIGLSPVIVARGLWALARTGKIIERRQALGRLRAPFGLLRFAGAPPGRTLPVLLNILRGDMSFAGPRPVSPQEAEKIPPDGLVRFAVRPGLVSRHALQRRLGIAYEAEASSDRNHYYEQTLRGDLGLVARSIPASLLSQAAADGGPPFLDLFGVTLTNTTMEEAVDWVDERCGRAEDDTVQVAFVNSSCLNIACTNPEYHRVLRAMGRVLPDGIGIRIGCRLLGSSLQANVNGTDLFPLLCERLAATGRSIYLLGARPGVAEAAAEAMQARYPALRVAGTRHGYFDRREEDAVIEEINAAGASVLLVALGVPAQELWLARHRARLRVPVQMGVGGLFDFYSGRIRRAPQWMRELGMEWSWRLLQEPGRMWRRYLIGNWVFLHRVWRQARHEAPRTSRRTP